MDNKDLDESLTELGFSNDLVNYFPDYTTLKTTYAVQELKNRYELIQHPVAGEIVKLLEATNTFHSATDPNFRAMRESALSDADLLGKLDDMAAALLDYTSKLATLQNANEKNIAAAAQDYCLQSIADRIEELKQANDRIYFVYIQNDSTLKQMMKSL